MARLFLRMLFCRLPAPTYCTHYVNPDDLLFYVKCTHLNVMWTYILIWTLFARRDEKFCVVSCRVRTWSRSSCGIFRFLCLFEKEQRLRVLKDYYELIIWVDRFVVFFNHFLIRIIIVLNTYKWKNRIVYFTCVVNKSCDKMGYRLLKIIRFILKLYGTKIYFSC